MASAASSSDLEFAWFLKSRSGERDPRGGDVLRRSYCPLLSFSYVAVSLSSIPCNMSVSTSAPASSSFSWPHPKKIRSLDLEFLMRRPPEDKSDDLAALLPAELESSKLLLQDESDIACNCCCCFGLCKSRGGRRSGNTRPLKKSSSAVDILQWGVVVVLIDCKMEFPACASSTAPVVVMLANLLAVNSKPESDSESTESSPETSSEPSSAASTCLAPATNSKL